LDLGLGPAVARRIAAARDQDDVDVGALFWTAIWLSCLTSVIGAAAVFFGATAYFGNMAETSSGLRSEVARTIPFVAAIVPILMVQSPLGGALQGRERFLALNVLGVFGNTLLTLLPLLFAYFWKADLTALVAGALVARLVPFPIACWLCRGIVPLGRPQRPSLQIARDLFGFGGWMSLTGFTSGLIGTIDRLVIGATIGAAAVSAYAIPYSLVSRIVVVPHSLGQALFPRFAYVDAEERARLLSSSIRAVAVIITPITIAVLAACEPFFDLWIGPELTSTSAPLAYVLAGGFWVYCIGYPGFSMLQAKGRPDLVCKLFIAELGPYALALFVGLWAFGLVGAAAVLTVRFAADTAIMVKLAGIPSASLKFLYIPAALTIASVAVAATMSSPSRYLVLAAFLAASLVWSARNIPDVLRPYLHKAVSLLGIRSARWGS
jgi:O-antigen/teichoic acid export membrane protein